MRKQYEKPSIKRSIIITESQTILKASVKSTELGVDQATESSDIVATPSLDPGEAEAWGDAKQWSWDFND